MKFYEQPFRPFSISCGLLPGYDVHKDAYSLETAKKCIGTWMAQRLRNEKKIAVGTILPGSFIYPVSDGFQTENAFHYNGMIRSDASEVETKEMLMDLARTLAGELEQKRVHVTYCDNYWILE